MASAYSNFITTYFKKLLIELNTFNPKRNNYNYPTVIKIFIIVGLVLIIIASLVSYTFYKAQKKPIIKHKRNRTIILQDFWKGKRLTYMKKLLFA